MDRIFGMARPDIVFHAAALKHVPLVEDNPAEGVRTNVGGTRIVADACRAHDVKAMVLISTDKAVHPSSVMGATKRIAELYCQALERESGPTRYVTVRFGNVLGSTGSVVPLFQRQLARGGPLTVTHPEVSRYFMTVREAVELVLQAAALPQRGAGGHIFVLDMGEPVLIADLARQMIRLTGLRPEIDVEIAYTGLRPGEKMHERLFHEAEPPVPTAADGILLAQPRFMTLGALMPPFAHLLEAAERRSKEDVTSALRALVPEFDPSAACDALAPAESA
jgi:O-antigen biosynthesis protein WbqV